MSCTSLEMSRLSGRRILLGGWSWRRRGRFLRGGGSNRRRRRILLGGGSRRKRILLGEWTIGLQLLEILCVRGLGTKPRIAAVIASLHQLALHTHTGLNQPRVWFSKKFYSFISIWSCGPNGSWIECSAQTIGAQSSPALLHLTTASPLDSTVSLHFVSL